MKNLEYKSIVLVLNGCKVLEAVNIDTGDEASKLCVVSIGEVVQSVERDHLFSDDYTGWGCLVAAIRAAKSSLSVEEKIFTEKMWMANMELKK